MWAGSNHRLVFWSVLLHVLACCSAKAPVIIVPGLAGSVLEAKRARNETPHWDCTSESDWEVLWLSPLSAARPQCLMNEMEVTFDPDTGQYHNQSGVEIRPLDWGGVEGLVALAPDLPQTLTSVYGDLIQGFKDEGYRVGRNLFGAPYDFRLAADGLEQVGFFTNLTLLVERAVRRNHGAPAVLVSHSMGCLVSLYFLQGKTPGWRRRHLGSLLALSGPWEGSVMAFLGSVSGNPLGISVLPHDFFRPLEANAPSGPWLFPREGIWGDKVLARTKGGITYTAADPGRLLRDLDNLVLVRTTGGDNYTAADAGRLLQDLNLTQQAALWPHVQGLVHPLEAQDIDFDLHCIYGNGTGNDTDETYTYDVKRFSGEAPPAPSNTTRGPGDGTVNLASLAACTKLGDSVTVAHMPNATHTGILADTRAIAYVVRLAQKHSPSASLGAGLFRWLRQVAGVVQPRRVLTRAHL